MWLPPEVAAGLTAVRVLAAGPEMPVVGLAVEEMPGWIEWLALLLAGVEVLAKVPGAAEA